MKSLIDIIGDYHKFLEEIFFMIDDIDLDVHNMILDHICFRVATIEEYQNKKIELAELGILLTESIVNERNIATYKLHHPIEYKDRKIFLIELPSPKETNNYTTGLEHVEFVTKDNLQKIVNRYPQFAFETFGINKRINPDITLKLGKYCLRFHNQHLEDVIKGERVSRPQINSKNNHSNNRGHENKRPMNKRQKWTPKKS